MLAICYRTTQLLYGDLGGDDLSVVLSYLTSNWPHCEYWSGMYFWLGSDIYFTKCLVFWTKTEGKFVITLKMIGLMDIQCNPELDRFTLDSS